MRNLRTAGSPLQVKQRKRRRLESLTRFTGKEVAADAHYGASDSEDVATWPWAYSLVKDLQRKRGGKRH